MIENFLNLLNNVNVPKDKLKELKKAVKSNNILALRTSLSWFTTNTSPNLTNDDFLEAKELAKKMLKEDYKLK